jgi:hypothetical protein
MVKVNRQNSDTLNENLTASYWKKFYKLNNYYHRNLQQLASHLIPENVSLIEFGCRAGETLAYLKNVKKVGVEKNQVLLDIAKINNPKLKLIHIDDFAGKLKGRKFDYILLCHTLSEVEDVQLFIERLKNICHEDTRIVVFYFSFLWKPILDFAEKVGLKLPQYAEPNWLSSHDINNFFKLEDLEEVKSGKFFLFPYNLSIISDFINRYIAPLPVLNNFCLENYSIFRIKKSRRDYSVSIVIPARNEEGNIRGVLEKIPNLGKKTEVVFVEGHSKDDTYNVIKEEIKRYKGPIKASLYKQKGKGKRDAVRLGFSKAKNELLMILDADLTVDPKELLKFYNVIASGKTDFVMGSRLVYPMEKMAMRDLNVLGNKFFSLVFTYLLDQKIKDTLCGTKVLLKKDYEKIARNRTVFGDFDPFGDHDLIFGAAKLNMKVVEIPIRYKERTYGKTNISRFKHGLLLLKMVGFAAKNLKFI